MHAFKLDVIVGVGKLQCSKSTDACNKAASGNKN